MIRRPGQKKLIFFCFATVCLLLVCPKAVDPILIDDTSLFFPFFINIEMSLSTRHSIQWDSTDEYEDTETLVITSPQGKFIDIRPIIGAKDIEWFFAGFEIDLGDNRIEFNHEFYDSRFIQNFYETGKGGLIESDVGFFTDSQDPEEASRGIRLESGKMMNQSTGKVENYTEKWVTINPLLKNFEWTTADSSLGVRCLVLDTIAGGMLENGNMDNPGVKVGRLIILGNWVQGVIWDNSVKENMVNAVGVVRGFITDDKVEFVIQYGAKCALFPSLNHLTDLNLHETITFNEVSWKVTEINHWEHDQPVVR